MMKIKIVNKFRINNLLYLNINILNMKIFNKMDRYNNYLII